MKERLNFTYKSIGNIMKLLATIQFEMTESDEEISIWHERFDNSDADSIFEKFLEELFPNGKNIGKDEINAVVFRAKKFLENDEISKNIRNEHIKRQSAYWVYFRPDNVVYKCGFAEHFSTVQRVCVDFFNGFDSLDAGYLRKFIIKNFEICSDNSTVEGIAMDSDTICNTILFESKYRKYKKGSPK